MRQPIDHRRRALAVTLGVMMLMPAWSAGARDPLYSMLNEDLTYDVSFLWFSGLAAARIRLQPDAVAGRYVASLEARTLGLTAFLTRHRRNRYETTMELVDGRLRPLRHEAVDTRGTGDSTRHRRTVYEFDYEHREILFRKTKTGFPDEDELRILRNDLRDVLRKNVFTGEDMVRAEVIQQYLEWVVSFEMRKSRSSDFGDFTRRNIK